MKRYRAPDPTPEQIENAKAWGFDPNDLAGSLPIWDLSPEDTLAAAATIHDELYMEGGPLKFAKLVDANFARDCMILARATDNPWLRAFEEAKARCLIDIVNVLGSRYWHEESRNTLVTRGQGENAMRAARQWVNACAAKLQEPPPYPLAVGPAADTSA